MEISLRSRRARLGAAGAIVALAVVVPVSVLAAQGGGSSKAAATSTTTTSTTTTAPPTTTPTTQATPAPPASTTTTVPQLTITNAWVDECRPAGAAIEDNLAVITIFYAEPNTMSGQDEVHFTTRTVVDSYLGMPFPVPIVLDPGPPLSCSGGNRPDGA